MESVRKGGVVLRREREAARRTRFDGAADTTGAGDALPGASGSEKTKLPDQVRPCMVPCMEIDQEL